MRLGPLANESENYRKSREELFAAEVALRDQRERVAQLRRKLPLGRKEWMPKLSYELTNVQKH